MKILSPEEIRNEYRLLYNIPHDTPIYLDGGGFTIKEIEVLLNAQLAQDQKDCEEEVEREVNNALLKQYETLKGEKEAAVKAERERIFQEIGENRMCIFNGKACKYVTDECRVLTDSCTWWQQLKASQGGKG
jgi:hypothetical protein